MSDWTLGVCVGGRRVQRPEGGADLCALVVIRNERGEKGFLAIEDGVRESETARGR